jgi:hypothetical protein
MSKSIILSKCVCLKISFFFSYMYNNFKILHKSFVTTELLFIMIISSTLFCRQSALRFVKFDLLGHWWQIMGYKFDKVCRKLSTWSVHVYAIQPLACNFIQNIYNLVFLWMRKNYYYLHCYFIKTKFFLILERIKRKMGNCDKNEIHSRLHRSFVA